MQRAVDGFSDLENQVCTFASLIGHGFYHHYTTPNTGPDSPSQLSSNYSYASFGRSGVNFWLISPFRWFSDGVFVFYLNPNGHSNNSQTFWSPSLRPTISSINKIRYRRQLLLLLLEDLFFQLESLNYL